MTLFGQSNLYMQPPLSYIKVTLQVYAKKPAKYGIKFV